MKLSKILMAFAVLAIVFTACKQKNTDQEQTVDNTVVVDAKSEKLALNISGMTCEIGCAKVIESKLSKQDGVLDAKVIFVDSLAKIEFDPAKTNKAALMSFVGGIADNMYKVTEADCKKVCDKEKKACDKDKKACKTTDCSKVCCVKEASTGDEKVKACAEACEKKCCV